MLFMAAIGAMLVSLIIYMANKKLAGLSCD